MYRGSAPRVFALALLMACQVTACHVESCRGNSSPAPILSPQHATRAPTPVKRGPTQLELTAGMVEAVTVGQSTVPVAARFEVPQRPVVGQSLEVVVAVMPLIAAGSATLQVMGSDGLQLAPGATPLEMRMVEPTQVYRQRITVVPTLEGVQLLDLTVSLHHDDVTETRTFSLPIIVATAADKVPL